MKYAEDRAPMPPPSRLARLRARLPESLEGRLGAALVALVLIEAARFAFDLLHELAALGQILEPVSDFGLAVVRRLIGL